MSTLALIDRLRAQTTDAWVELNDYQLRHLSFNPVPGETQEIDDIDQVKLALQTKQCVKLADMTTGEQYSGNPNGDSKHTIGSLKMSDGAMLYFVINDDAGWSG